MPSDGISYPSIRDALSARYGQLGSGHEGRAPFEAVVATLLDRALDARKRDTVIEALRDDGLLDPQTLAGAEPDELDESLRSAGVKVARGGLALLLKLARWLVERHHGSADELADPASGVATSQLRDELVAINGIGPATADAVLLFGLNRGVYPLDRATYRILVRHGWTDPDAGYDEARDAVERLADGDPGSLAALSVWFDRLGRDHCRATVAKCERCPLAPFLPDGGPLDPTG
jgi:endonuclease-3 related protein